jgi:subtilisin-like proprotein convertase family protein
MQFIYKDLGPRQIGEIVEVTLTNPSNVRLMDDLNFANYKNGVKHIYTGGVVRQSTVRLQVPTHGHWHLAVDTQGLQISGSFGATVKMVEN